MQGVQKRPLSGMLSSGVYAPRQVGNGVSTIAHTLDNTTDQLGGPFVDMVELWVSNGSGGAVTLTLTVAGGTPIVLDIADNDLTKVLDDAVFANASGSAAATITVSGSGAGLVFWGSFSRPL